LDQIQCEGKYAKYPTIGGVIKMCNFFGLTDLAKEFSQKVHDFVHPYNEDSQDPVPDPTWFAKILQTDIFRGLVYPVNNAFPSVKQLQLSDATKEKKDSWDSSMYWYRKHRKIIQDNVNIRFAFLDGQHRVAIAIHLLAGYVVTPKQNLHKNQTKFEKYELTKEMKLNGKPTLRFAVPNTHALQEDFILACVKQSNDIIN
jgi:hypothetical protein